MPRAMAPANESPEALELSLRWGLMFDRFAPTAVLGRLLDDYIMMGWALAQISYERVIDESGNRVWEPRLNNEESQFVNYEHEPNAYFYETREGRIQIEPGNGKWVLLEAGERGFRNGAIRALGLMWHLRELSWFDWARYTERHGQPLLKAMVPSEVQAASREAFWNDIISLGRESAVLLPQGVGSNKTNFDVQIVEARDGNWKAFQELKRDATIAVAVYLLGQNLTTEIQAGSYAAANVHRNIRNEVLQADEKELGGDLLEQAMRPISDLMVPNGRLIAPRPTWNTQPPADKKQDAETAKIAAETIASLQEVAKAGRLKIDNLPEFARQFGIELSPDDDAPEVGAELSAVDQKERAATLETVARTIGNFARQGVPLDIDELIAEFNIPIDRAAFVAVGQQLFQYHLQFGTVTINEVRKRLGMGPVAGGDQLIEPPTMEALSAFDDDETREAFMFRHFLAQARARGSDESDEFNRGLSSEAAKDAARSLNARLLQPLLDAIAGAETEEEIRAAVFKIYGETSPEIEQEILESLSRLAELNALHDVEQDLGATD